MGTCLRVTVVELGKRKVKQGQSTFTDHHLYARVCMQMPVTYILSPDSLEN